MELVRRSLEKGMRAGTSSDNMVPTVLGEQNWETEYSSDALTFIDSDRLWGASITGAQFIL